jgi:hypothetical protein
MITTTTEIYEFTELTMKKCREQGYTELAQQLEDAMHLGSSGLEILGAIKAIFLDQATALEKIVDKAKLQEVVMYAEKAFGMKK